MYNKELERLVIISSEVGSKGDYVQGGGGNTSYKLSGDMMAVKASGFRLDQISTETGYVVLDYRQIRDYYNNTVFMLNIDYENESSTMVKGSVIPFAETEKYRPSVEAGFHSLLDRTVIHSHSVYANIICCSYEGRELIKKIFGDEYNIIYLPYVNPGFALSYAIKNEIDKYFESNNRKANVIFMENHGLVVTDNDHFECLRLHEEINKKIRMFFNLGSNYPSIGLEDTSDGFISKTGFISDFSKKNDLSKEFIDSKILYPDQIVYLNNNIGIRFDSDTIKYSTNIDEAETIEETLLAYLYVLDIIDNKNLTLRKMPASGIDFINNWESEKYRKKMAEKTNI